MLSAAEEADFVEALEPRPHSVLDAGCGTGRVAIELARRGYTTLGVDISPGMLVKARRAAPHLAWRLGDLAHLRLSRRFDLVLLAGNVLLFLRPGSEPAVLRNMARHLAPGGVLVSGFYLSMGRLQLDDYDAFARRAGLVLRARYAGWRREPWQPFGPYAVSLHTIAP